MDFLGFATRNQVNPAADACIDSNLKNLRFFKFSSFFGNLSCCAAQICQKSQNLRKASLFLDFSRVLMNCEALRASNSLKLRLEMVSGRYLFSLGPSQLWDTRRGRACAASLLWELQQSCSSFPGRCGNTGWMPAHGKGRRRITYEIMSMCGKAATWTNDFIKLLVNITETAVSVIFTFLLYIRM